MASGKNKHYVSIWFWMFAIFVMAIPCIGFIMTIVWAYVGENETRKNFFKATLAWYLIVAVLWAGIMLLGFSPLIYREVQAWLQRFGS